MFRHRLLEMIAPVELDVLAAGTAVVGHEYRIAFVRIEAEWLVDAVVEILTVLTFQRSENGADEAVVIRPIRMADFQFVVFDPGKVTAVGFVQRDLRRRRRIGIGVEIERGIFSEHRLVPAFARTDEYGLVHIAAIQSCHIDLLLQWIVAVCREVHFSILFVERQQLVDVPVALGQRTSRLAIEADHGEMRVTFAFGRPDQRVFILEETQVVVEVDPGRTRFGQQGVLA